MKRTAQSLLLALSILNLAQVPGRILHAQEDPNLDAAKRRFPDVGAGFRAIRRGPDGTYYVLTAASTPAPASKRAKPSKASKHPDAALASEAAVLVFDSVGAKLRQFPAQPGLGESASPDSLDIDASGRVYVADAAGNAVSIYAADGTLFAHFRIAAPRQIIVLPHDQFAVCSASADHLISVYDLRGTLLREFGELAELSDDAELNIGSTRAPGRR